jgi:hypothetical protein
VLLEGAREAGDGRLETHRSTFLPELREAYALWRFKFGMELALGRRVLTWGKTDFTRPLDVLNPLDMRDGPVDVTATQKLGVFNLEATQTVGNFSFSFIWIPFFQPNRVDLFGSDWSMLKPQLALPIPDAYSGLLDVIHPTRYEEMQGLMSATTDPPQDGILGADYALRITGNVAGVDLGLAYTYQWDKMPMVDIDAEKLTGSMLGVIGGDSKSIEALRQAMKIEYKRRHVVGGDFGFTLGNFTLKGDVAFFHEHTFYKTDFESLRRPALTWAFQIDYLHQDILAISLEFSHQAIFGLPADTELLFMDENLMRLSGSIQVRFGPRRKFQLQLGGMYGITQQDAVLTPRFTWRHSSAFSLNVGAVLFFGKEDGVSVGSLFDTADFAYLSTALRF